MQVFQEQLSGLVTLGLVAIQGTARSWWNFWMFYRLSKMRTWLLQSCKSGQNRFVVPFWRNLCSENLSLDFPWWLKPCAYLLNGHRLGHGCVLRSVGKLEDQEPSPCHLFSVPQNNLRLLSTRFTSLLGMCLSKQKPSGPSAGITLPFFWGYHPPVSNPHDAYVRRGK